VILTDVPVGAWTTAVLLDLAGDDPTWRRAARGATAVGIVGALASAVTGLTDWHVVAGRRRRVGLVHALLNTAALSLFAGSLGVGDRRDGGTARALRRLGYAVATGSAYLGGWLVYDGRMGVDNAAVEETPRDFVDVCADDELRDGEPKRAMAGAVPVVLVRRAGRVHALVETCAHLSGPLAEGRLEGDAIRCPWHGSLFALEDGRVLEGPSVHPQPCFEVRVAGGRIAVRHARS